MGGDRRSESIDPTTRVRGGLKAVAEWEAQQGAFTAEELAQADAALDRLLGDQSYETNGPP
jgi:hypothetical protein